MTAGETKMAFLSGSKVNLRNRHGVFLDCEISALTYRKERNGKVYAVAELISGRDKNSVLGDGIENLEPAL